MDKLELAGESEKQGALSIWDHELVLVNSMESHCLCVDTSSGGQR